MDPGTPNPLETRRKPDGAAVSGAAPSPSLIAAQELSAPAVQSGA